MKKLLGLLAITPMAVTACGSADPVVKEEVKEMEYTYSEVAQTLTIKNILLDGIDDNDGLHDLGYYIKTNWALYDTMGDATRVVLHGLIGDEELKKEIDVDGILNDADNATPFDDFRGALNHYYKEADNMSSYANFAKHLKDAGDHITPVEVTDAEKEEIMDKIKWTFYKNDGTKDNKWLSTITDSVLNENIQEKGYKIKNKEDAVSSLGITEGNWIELMDSFNNTLFEFMDLDFSTHKPTGDGLHYLDIYFYHESEPETIIVSSGTIECSNWIS